MKPRKPTEAVAQHTFRETAAKLKINYTKGILNEETGKNFSFTEKEKLFILFYLTDANFIATHAVKMAGYNCTSDHSFQTLASEMMQKPKIRLAIDRALASFGISKNEVLYRLAAQARGDITLLLDDDGVFDLDVAKENGATCLIKEIEQTRTILETKREVVDKPQDAPSNLPRRGMMIPTDEPDEYEETIETNLVSEKVKIKLYSSQAALKLLGDHWKLFTQRHELTGANGESLETGKVVVYLPDNGRGDSDEDAIETK